MTHLRLKRQRDPLLTTLDCQPGDRVLDTWVWDTTRW